MRNNGKDKRASKKWGRVTLQADKELCKGFSNKGKSPVISASSKEKIIKSKKGARNKNNDKSENLPTVFKPLQHKNATIGKKNKKVKRVGDVS